MKPRKTMRKAAATVDQARDLLALAESTTEHAPVAAHLAAARLALDEAATHLADAQRAHDTITEAQ